MHTVVTPKPGLEAGYKVRGWAAHMVRRVHFMYQKGPGTLGTAAVHDTAAPWQSW